MKTRKIALILIMILALSLLTACRCEPASETWYLSSYVKKSTFIGGVERSFGFSQASIIYPFAYADLDKSGISFTEDGKVSFSTYEGEALDGTYTFEHVGNYTVVTITFENGESIKADCIKQSDGSWLIFTFRDVKYTFYNYKREKGMTLDEIVAEVRGGNTEGLHPATVEREGDVLGVVFNEFVYYPIGETTAVYAIHIKADGTYEVLDEIREGEVYSTYNNDGDYVVLYYIDPVK